MIYLILMIIILYVIILYRKSKELRTGIEIWMGLPGAGKSTMAAVLAKKAQKNGYKVYSNFPIDGTLKLDKSDFLEYNIENGLVLLDEAGIEFDSRDWQKFSQKHTEFFKTHRHYKLRVVLFTQFWDDVDKKIRMLTNRIYVVRKSIFPFSVVSKEIKSFLGISEEKQIVMQYDWKPRVFFGTRHYYVISARKIFNSWSHRDLPEKEWETWVVNKKIIQIKKESFYRKMFKKLTKSAKT